MRTQWKALVTRKSWRKKFRYLGKLHLFFTAVGQTNCAVFSTSVTQLSSLQGEVDKILAELTDGKLGEAPKVPEGSLAGPSKPQVGIFQTIGS